VTGPTKGAQASDVADPGRARRDFFRNLRHELRTPMNHILGYSELLLEEAADSGQTDLVPSLEQVHAAGKETLALINERLGASRLEAQRIDLAALRQALAVPLDAILAAAAIMQEQAATLGQEDLVPDLQRIDAAARHLLALVADGLPPAGLETEGGAARDEGETRIPPQPTREAATTVPPAPADAGAPTARGALLVVDDNEGNRDLLARRLERLGYAVAEAENGRRALEMIQAGGLDLVLLDIMMPEMNGYQVLERLKADVTWRELPVIVISALDELSSVVRCIRMGAEDYLPKPFDPVLLQARIGACLEQKRLRDQEIAYLRNVARVTAAAAAVEAAAFRPGSLAEVAARDDPLGQLARVFERMAGEVYAREQRLKAQVRELRIEIDQVKKARQVAEITETDYFHRLQSRAKELRRRSRP
jgi:DNA-binding response OmpR family regulator